MDGTRFDWLTQQLGRAGEPRTGRRGLLAVAAALVTGAFVSAEDAAAKTRRHRHRKNRPRGLYPHWQALPQQETPWQEGKKLGCNRCCQRHVTTTPDGKQVCACQPTGLPCSETLECCSGVCTGGACREGAAQCTSNAQCGGGQVCIGSACQN